MHNQLQIGIQASPSGEVSALRNTYRRPQLARVTGPLCKDICFHPEVFELSIYKGNYDQKYAHATKSLCGPSDVSQGRLPRQAKKSLASARQTSLGEDRKTIVGVMAKVHFR